jgi:hypothetical protein
MQTTNFKFMRFSLAFTILPKNNKTSLGLQAASELYQESDPNLSVKLVSNFIDRECSVVLTADKFMEGL